MNLKTKLDNEISKRAQRPKGIRFSVSTFKELEQAGYIARGNGGPAGMIEWASNVPWYSQDIYAWCDPSFQGEYELPPA